jgi:uncharacterized paraquat-inducible protein A
MYSCGLKNIVYGTSSLLKVNSLLLLAAQKQLVEEYFPVSSPVIIDRFRNCVLSSILLSRECRFGRRAVLDAIAYQRTYQAARTRLLRHYGLCVACGKAEAQAGRTRCRRCAVYASERTKKWLRNRTAGDAAPLPANSDDRAKRCEERAVA